MTTAGDRLTAAFAEGARQIDAIPNRLDREVGFAALRVDAEDAARRLATRSPGEDVTSFEAWRSNFTDGATPVAALDWLDKQAKARVENIAKEVATWAWTGAQSPLLAGIFGFITGVVIAFIDWGRNLGFGITALVLGGTVSAGPLINAVRALGNALPGMVNDVQSTTKATLDSAKSIGSHAERIISQSVRPVVLEVTSGAGVVAGPSAAFIQRLRQRALGALYVGYSVLLAGVLTIGVGIATGVSEAVACQQRVTLPTSPSLFPAQDSSSTNC